MSRSRIIEKLKSMKWLDSHWRTKDFIISENEDTIKYSYIHGDMGLVDKVIYYKKDSFCEVYNLNNYYGDMELFTSLYI